MDDLLEACSGDEIAVFLALARQHNGQNNGWLRIPEIKPVGRTKTRQAMKSLEQKGFILKTRQGRGGADCNLYALAHLSINSRKEMKHENSTANLGFPGQRSKLQVVR